MPEPTHPPASAPFPHRFIAIEGNIGAGKTTLCQMLHRDFDCRLVLEQFTDNPFLPLFYENPERYAFPVELFFMTERHKQLQEAFSREDLFHPLTVSDYIFFKTLLFARNNLQGAEYRLFHRLFEVLNASAPLPDLLVFLYRSVPDLLRNIHHRGRSIEKSIKPEYLEGLHSAYLQFLRTQTALPILLLDVDGVYFWDDDAAYRQIVGLLQQSYPPGLHRRSIEGKKS